MKSSADDLEDLILSAKNGDDQAMTELVTIHKALVFTIALRMTNDYDASQDLTQEAFVKMCINIRKVRNAAHFKPWLCTIVRNVVRDHFRRIKKERTISFEQIKERCGASNIEITRKRAIIQDALGKLAERDRMLLTLTYYHGMTMGEVAQTMEMQESNVRVCLHRARKRLREHLAGYEHELLFAS